MVQTRQVQVQSNEDTSEEVRLVEKGGGTTSYKGGPESFL